MLYILVICFENRKISDIIAVMERLDIFLTQKGYFSSRARSQMEIKAGNIIVNGKVQTKSNIQVGEDDEIVISQNVIKYVSRAGLKLEKAQQEWDLEFSDKVVLDVGSSTGGFSDFCLQNGARKVYSLDVGVNQLDVSLRNNSKIVVMESTDIRNVSVDKFCDVDMIVCDVSFISLKLIAQKISQILRPKCFAVVLIKPQFECGKQYAKKCGGVVKDEKVRLKAVDEVVDCFNVFNLVCRSVISSPILGGDGNKEYLCLLEKV